MNAQLQYIDPACYIRRVMPGDMWLILPDVRSDEVRELAALGVTPEHCVRGGMSVSRAFFISLYGEPAGIFGAVEHEDHAVPWGVFTTAIERYPIPFLRAGRLYLSSLQMRLENFVAARNEKTILWLEWLGFTVDEDLHAVGIHGENFRRFHRCAIG